MMRRSMVTRYTQRAHATWKHAPMNPAKEMTRMTNPIIRSGVWRKLWHVVLFRAIQSPAPIMGMEARRENRLRNPITVLLSLFILMVVVVVVVVVVVKGCFGG